MSDVLLPIGSVVEIEGDDGLYFILGFYPELEGRSYDYLVAAYPQGLLEVPSAYYLDSDVICNVVFRGYQDALGQEALDAIKQMVDLRGQMNSEIAQVVAEALRDDSELSIDEGVITEPIQSNELYNLK